MRVLVFGDSIAYGAWDVQGGWVERLKKYAHERTITSFGENKLQVLNLGIGGDSSSRILARLRQEIDARKSESWPLILMFQFCANDARTFRGISETRLSVFSENVEQIIAEAQSVTDRIIFIGELLFKQEEIEFKGALYSSKKVSEYEAVLQKIVKKRGITFISLKDEEGSNVTRDFISYDGIHPNDKGHERIFRLVVPEIENFIQ